MRKAHKRIIIALIVLLAVLTIPCLGHSKDARTRYFTALTYKVIVWHRISPDTPEIGPTIFETGTDFYLFPYNFKSEQYYYERYKEKRANRQTA